MDFFPSFDPELISCHEPSRDRKSFSSLFLGCSLQPRTFCEKSENTSAEIFQLYLPMVLKHLNPWPWTEYLANTSLTYRAKNFCLSEIGRQITKVFKHQFSDEN